MNHALVSEFKHVIRRAMLDGDFDRAQLARETAFEKHDIDLLDYLRHPSLRTSAV